MLVRVLIRHGQCHFHCCHLSRHSVSPLVSGPRKCYYLCLGLPASCDIQTNKYYNQQQLQSTTIHNVLWRSSQSMFGCTYIDIYSTRFSRVVSVGLISTKPHPPTTCLMLGTSEGGLILCSLICLCTLILY